jgi:uncharacterized SAM-binding protein YcdF (DUF218 family)
VRAERGAVLVLAAAGLLAAGLWAWVEREALLQAAGDFLVVRDPLHPADVVVAVSGDGVGERVRTAADLVRRGYAPYLLLSGSRIGPPPGAAADMLATAQAAGVPAGRILVDDQALSTMDNARHTAAVMAQRGWRRAIVVSSPYHTRRTAWAFRQVLRRRGLHVAVVAAEPSFFTVERWWTRERDRWLVVREYQKLGAFILGLQ